MRVSKIFSKYIEKEVLRLWEQGLSEEEIAEQIRQRSEKVTNFLKGTIFSNEDLNSELSEEEIAVVIEEPEEDNDTEDSELEIIDEEADEEIEWLNERFNTFFPKKDDGVLNKRQKYMKEICNLRIQGERNVFIAKELGISNSEIISKYWKIFNSEFLVDFLEDKISFEYAYEKACEIGEKSNVVPIKERIRIINLIEPLYLEGKNVSSIMESTGLKITMVTRYLAIIKSPSVRDKYLAGVIGFNEAYKEAAEFKKRNHSTKPFKQSKKQKINQITQDSHQQPLLVIDVQESQPSPSKDVLVVDLVSEDDSNPHHKANGISLGADNKRKKKEVSVEKRIYRVDTIQKLVKKGHSFEYISKVITKSGDKFSRQTVGKYWSIINSSEENLKNFLSGTICFNEAMRITIILEKNAIKEILEDKTETLIQGNTSDRQTVEICNDEEVIDLVSDSDEESFSE